MRKFIILVCISLLSLAMPIHAQHKWSELGEKQKHLLLPFAENWNNLDTKTQNTLLENTNKWLNMTPVERKMARMKLKELNQLDAQKHAKIRERLQRFENLTPQERQKLIQAHRRFKNLTPQQQRRLKQKFRNLSPQEKEKFLRKQKRKQQRHAFINQFDINKRPLIKSMFKNMDKELRRKLLFQMKSLSKDEKHQFILELLDMDAATREATILQKNVQ